MSELLNLLAKITIDKSDYEKGLDDAEKSAGGFGKKLGSALGSGVATLAKAGVAAIGAATAATTAFAASSVKVGASFDSAMAQVAATSGKTMEELLQTTGQVDTAFGHFSGNLREYAQFMGANTAFSAKQAADALNYMALAGYDAQTSMNMLPNVLNLASAGAMDLARASDMITDTQTAFGLSLERTNLLVDEMAKAASTGNTSVEQLGDAFLVVGGLAQELNGGFVFLDDNTQVAVDGIQEMEIALTAMANAGIKGSEAGTHMRNMIMKLSSPTKQGAEVMEELGLHVFNAQGEMRPLSNIVHDLNLSLKDLTQEQKIKAISKLFNSRDLASAEALLGAIEQDWDEIGASILEAKGSASKMAATQLDNLAGDITIFKSALEGAQIAISDKLTPSLRSFVQIGTQGLSNIKEAIETGDMEGAMNIIADSVKNAVSAMTTVLPDLIKVGTKIVGAIVTGLIENVPELMSSVEVLAQAVVEGIAENGPMFLNSAKQILTMLVNGIISGLPIVTEQAVALINGLAGGISTALPNLIPVAMETLMTFSGSLRENVGSLVDAGLNLIMTLATALIDNLPVFIQTVPTIVSNIAGIINDNAPKLLACGIELIGKLLAGIIESVPVLIQEFPKIVKMIADVITAFNWLNLGKHIITFIKNGVTTLATEIPNALHNIGNNAVNLVKNINWATLGTDIINFIKGGITSLVSEIPNALQAIGHQAVELFKSIDWVDLGKNIILGIVSGITNSAGLALKAIGGVASDVINAGKRALGIASPSKVFRYYGEMVDEGFALGISENMGRVDRAINDLTDIPAPQIDVGSGVDSSENYRGNVNNVTINVYGAEGQDERVLAQRINEILQNDVYRKKVVWG